MHTRLIIAVITLATVAGCGAADYGSPTGTGAGNNNPSGTTSTSNAIAVQNNSFDPTPTTVPIGTTVTWTWAGDATTHNVTFTDGQHSADQGAGAVYQRTFATAGTYSYSCTIHPGMTGQVKVQ